MTTSRKPTPNVLDFELELEPVDWQQLYLLSRLTPGQRMLAMAQASAFARGILRGAFRRRFPDLPMAEINMMVLRYVSSVTEYRRE
jgi:hypothetical protein